MNELTQSLTMSSNQIAKLTGKQHNHVLRDIDTMLTKIHGEKDVSNFGSIFFDSYGREQKCFILDEDHTLTLILGYDAKARFAVVQDWKRLKAIIALPPVPAGLPNFLDPQASARAWADERDARTVAEVKLIELAPKVEAYNRLETSSGSLTPREAAKCIDGITQTGLVEWLLNNGWCYRDQPRNGKTGSLRMYAHHRASGRIEERLVSAGSTQDGDEITRAQVYLTPKGINHIAKSLGSDLPEWSL